METEHFRTKDWVRVPVGMHVFHISSIANNCMAMSIGWQGNK